MDEGDSKPPTSLDDLREGFQTVRHFKGYLLWLMMHIVPFVAVAYGAEAWKPYYFFLGLAGLFLIVVLHRLEQRWLASLKNDADSPARPTACDQKLSDQP
jgi:hypothetical protein